VSRLNRRVMLVQLLANAVVIGLVIGLLPGFELRASRVVLAVLWLAVVFGLLSALVRPALEFVFLPYMLQSLGLVVVVIDAVLLALLALTSTLSIDGIGALIAGAFVAGAAGFLLDGLLGLTPPVVDDPSARVARGERMVGIASVSERLRLIQLYGLLLQYTTDVAFDWGLFRPFRRRLQQWMWRPPVPISTLPSQVKARLLLEELGPTYVKIGQIVSSQGRVLPSAWADELGKLQSEVRPFAYEDVRAIVTGSLGSPPDDLYESFNPRPLAAASLAQVHEATMTDGRRVAVKVQRPNIHEQLRSDVRILQRGAAVLERRVRWARDADLSGVVREFGETLVRELDYTIEAYNARRLARVLSRVDGVHVPVVEPVLSSDRVLTAEFIEGVKATDVEAIDAAGLDREELARNLVRAAVQMVMVDGFFHADPHPGNVVVDLSTGRLTFLDTGMVGELDLRKRISFAAFLLAFRDRDIAGVASTLRALSRPFRRPDDAGYERRFEQRIGPLLDPPGGRVIHLERLVSEALEVLRGSGYQLDPQLTLAVKAVGQAEAITSALVPEADASYFAELGGAALDELVPDAIKRIDVRKQLRRQSFLAAGEAAQHFPTLQEVALTWLDAVKQGQIPVRVHVAGLEDKLTRFESVPRLFAAALVLSAVLIGSALAAAVGAGGSDFRTAVADASLVLYVIAAAVGVVLVSALLWRLVRPKAPDDR
jgi:ubiquinone biosynthesis protein